MAIKTKRSAPIIIGIAATSILLCVIAYTYFALSHAHRHAANQAMMKSKGNKDDIFEWSFELLTSAELRGRSFRLFAFGENNSQIDVIGGISEFVATAPLTATIERAKQGQNYLLLATSDDKDGLRRYCVKNINAQRHIRHVTIECPESTSRVVEWLLSFSRHIPEKLPDDLFYLLLAAPKLNLSKSSERFLDVFSCLRERAVLAINASFVPNKPDPNNVWLDLLGQMTYLSSDKNQVLYEDWLMIVRNTLNEHLVKDIELALDDTAPASCRDFKQQGFMDLSYPDLASAIIVGKHLLIPPEIGAASYLILDEEHSWHKNGLPVFSVGVVSAENLDQLRLAYSLRNLATDQLTRLRVLE